MCDDLMPEKLVYNRFLKRVYKPKLNVYNFFSSFSFDPFNDFLLKCCDIL